MAQVIKDITLEVSKPNVFQALVAKQCDSNSRFLNVTLVNEGKKISIDETSIVAINTCRNNGDSNSFSGEVNDDGTALLPIHAWVLELPGLVKCDVSVMDSEDHKLTSTTFYINVEEAANEEGVIADDIWIERINAETERVAAEEIRVAAESERVAAENARILAENARVAAENERKVIVDNTLTKEGYAADAKTTGEALKSLSSSAEAMGKGIERLSKHIDSIPVVTVGTGGDVSTIEEALTRLPNGGIVSLLPGEHSLGEPRITVDNIVITGTKNAVLIVTNQNGIVIKSDHVKISNLTIKSTRTGNGENVIKCVKDGGNTDITIENCEFDIEQCYMESIFGTFGTVLNCNNVSRLTIRDCIFNVGKCLQVISLYGVSDVVIEHNEFAQKNQKNSVKAILMQNSPKNVVISYNSISEFQEGIYCDDGLNMNYAERVSITSNRIYLGTDVMSDSNGIRFRGVNSIISGNIFPWSALDVSINVVAGDHILVENNNVTNPLGLCFRIADKDFKASNVIVTNNIGRHADKDGDCILIGTNGKECFVANNILQGKITDNGSNNTIVTVYEYPNGDEVSY